ncbi:MAG: GntR family transcriptional regulator [Sphaerochaetaceae bacterium]|jgi:DNA-binding transcriptional regulator YhcF (GntR family)|nr:GntR family transcriptional regulator [Sphaerochaetaceae bacterium]MDD3941855.1 GntR family transcriptional regulator [Sphaerochaetaceae bacterium]MDX9938374.1 GntR family transcriptional regulator [Sphaerochaetaceae bacterium]
MQFNKHTSIYLQIADYMYDRILSGEWPDGQRIPSIRDMAVLLEVNPNTVTRTYTMLQEEGTLENQRGIGYFTAADARDQVLSRKREAFLKSELPLFFSTIGQLGLTMDQIRKAHEHYQQEHEKS